MTYFEDYKEKNRRLFEQKEREFQKKHEIIKPVEKKQLILESISEESKKAIEEIKQESEKAWNFLKEPKHIKILKTVAVMIPFLILAYIVYSNFLSNQEFNYFYDIGNENENYLSPLDRISVISNYSESEINYRNLTSSLVYFNSQIPRNSKEIRLQIKFNENFPNGSSLSLGAKDREDWHYRYITVYNPNLNELSKFENNDNVYRINPNLPLLNPEQIKLQKNITIATDNNYFPEMIQLDFSPKSIMINNSLRGGHTFYVYLKDNLNLEVKKQDINWYEGSDELIISLYNLNNTLLINTTIPDDSITSITKIPAMVQSANLSYQVASGIYKLEFSNFDGLIREIKINTDKIITNKLFLADNSIYNLNTKPAKIFIKSKKQSQIKFITYHSIGFQNISIFSGQKNKVLINSTNQPSIFDTNPGEYELIIPNNDIIVSSNNYITFSRENYFEPFTQTVVPIEGDFEWIRNNADYVISNYKPPKKENNWLIAEIRFNLEELYIKDNKLSLLINTPHLSNPELSDYKIAIDWINITIFKPKLI